MVAMVLQPAVDQPIHSIPRLVSFEDSMAFMGKEEDILKTGRNVGWHRLSRSIRYTLVIFAPKLESLLLAFAGSRLRF